MSLSEAILAIAEGVDKERMEIDEDTEEYVHNKISRKTLKDLAEQLRIAVKAAGVISQSMQVQTNFSNLNAVDQHRSAVEAAKNEFRGKVKKIDGTKDNAFVEFADTHEDRLVEAKGGYLDGVNVPIPGSLKVGGELTSPNGEVYQLGEDGLLHYIRPAQIREEQPAKIIVPGK